MSLWPFLALALSAIAGYLLMIRPRHRASGARWVCCAACNQPAPQWRMAGNVCRGCAIDAQGVAVLRPTPPTPGRIVDVRADPRLASFWRDVREHERRGSGDTPDADRLLRRLYPEE